MSEYIEEVAQILYEMQFTIDKQSELLKEGLPIIRLEKPVLGFRKSVIFPYAENTFDIMEGQIKLGTLHFNRVGVTACEFIIRVGQQRRHSRVLSLKDDQAELLEEMTQLLKYFFPTCETSYDFIT